jgi:hypothetical protein
MDVGPNRVWGVELQLGRLGAAAARLAYPHPVYRPAMLQRGRPGAAATRDPTVIFTSNPELRHPAEANADGDLGKGCVRQFGVLATYRCSARHPAVR